jgi:SAM-dependent methyltransferase
MIFKTDKKAANIGCGRTAIPEEFNIDIVGDLPNIDMVWNLNKLPWPIESDQFEKITFNDILEHLDEPLKVVEELWRILTPGGICHIRVPNWEFGQAYRDITHKRPYQIDTFDLFDPSTEYGQDYGFYSKCHFTVLEKRKDGQELVFVIKKI